MGVGIHMPCLSREMKKCIPALVGPIGLLLLDPKYVVCWLLCCCCLPGGLDKCLVLVDGEDVLALCTVVEHVAIFVGGRYGFGFDIYQENGIFLVHWTLVVHVGVKAHLLPPLSVVISKFSTNCLTLKMTLYKKRCNY